MKRHLLLLLSCSIYAQAWAAPPRVAVISDPSAAAFGDVLSAELSKTADSVEWVERAQLDRIATEQQVQDLNAVDRPLALARLAKADGLLFATVEADDAKHPLLMLRLSHAASGRITQSLVLPWLPTELETNAALAAERFRHSLQQLHAAGHPASLTISLLGLHASVDSPAAQQLETHLNILLGNQLAQQPGVTVLERWRMDDLVFERSLSKIDLPAFEKAALLVDGSLTSTPQGALIRLRLRRSESDQGTIHELSAPLSDPEKLISQMIRQIAGVAPSSRERDEDEAKSFAKLGRYLIQHDLAPQAAQALESAVALGDRSSETLLARVEAYAFCAYPHHLNSFETYSGRGITWKTIEHDADFRLAAALRAVLYMTELWEREAAQKTGSDSKILFCSGTGTFLAACQTLRAVYQAGIHPQHLTQTTELRTALQRLVPLLDKADVETKMYYFLPKAVFAPCWCATMEDTLAHYRLVFSSEYARQMGSVKSVPWPLLLRRELLISLPQTALFLDEPPSTSPFGISRLMDWSSTDKSQAQKLWAAFIHELLKAPDLEGQCLGRAFNLASHNNPETRYKLLAETTEFLFVNVDRLAKEGDERELEPLSSQFFSLLTGSILHGAKPDPRRDRFSEFLKAFFERSPWPSPTCFGWAADLAFSRKQANLTPKTVAEMVAALDGLTERCKRNNVLDIASEVGARRARGSLISACPEAVPPDGREVLRVSRIWNTYRHSPVVGGVGPWEHCSLAAFGDRVWFFVRGVGVVEMNPATLEAKVTPFKPDKFPMVQQVVPQGDNLWATTLTSIWHCDRKLANWSKLDLPERRYTITPTSDSLLFGSAQMPLNQQLAGGITIGEVTPSTPTHWLISSRRRPAEHPLDNLEAKHVISVFEGPRKALWTALAMNGGRVEVFSIAAPEHTQLTLKGSPLVKGCAGGTLLYETPFNNPQGSIVTQAWFVDSQSPSPILLLRDSAPLGNADNLQPRWPTPAILGGPGPHGHCVHCPTLYGNELWVLLWETSEGPSEMTLVGLIPGQTNPIEVPLRLEPSKEDVEIAEKHVNFADIDPAHANVLRSSLLATSHGLVFAGGPSPFVWIIPWSDIRSWVSKHASADGVKQPSADQPTSPAKLAP